MTRIACLLTVLLIACTGGQRALAQVPARASYAFIHANVVPMNDEQLLTDQTVLVEGGIIVAVGPAAETFVPDGAIQIDDSGRFLLPGLAEMHGHLPSGTETEDMLFLYLAGGATTVRGMQGHPAQLEIRQRVRSGELLGPRLWLAAPALSGQSAPDVSTAEERVRRAHEAGYDLLKIHEGLSQEVYERIVQLASELGLPWGGHVPQDVGVYGALAAGQSTIDHMDDYLEALQSRRSPAFDAQGAERRRLMAVHADRSGIDDLAEATFDAGVAIVPTQVLWETLGGARDPIELAAHPENRYMPRQTVRSWQREANSIYTSTSRIAAIREAEIRQELLQALNEAGVTILMGTDAPQLYSVPGFSLHRELEKMVEAGMTPFEVLQTGTVNVARHLDQTDTAGTIEAGKNADLLLLAANPLTDIRAVAQIAGVMIDGRWLPQDVIAARLIDIARRQQ